MYLASSEFLQGKLRDKYMLDATNLLTVSRNILSKVSDLDVMESELRNQKDVANFKYIYSDISNNEYLRSGNRTTDMMKRDLKTCQPIVGALLDGLPDVLRIKKLPNQ